MVTLHEGHSSGHLLVCCCYSSSPSFPPCLYTCLLPSHPLSYYLYPPFPSPSLPSFLHVYLSSSTFCMTSSFPSLLPPSPPSARLLFTSLSCFPLFLLYLLPSILLSMHFTGFPLFSSLPSMLTWRDRNVPFLASFVTCVLSVVPKRSFVTLASPFILIVYGVASLLSGHLSSSYLSCARNWLL